MNCPAAFAAMALVFTGAATHGATLIHRCGNEYTDLPCAAARRFSVSDSVSAAQRADARQVTAREKALAEEMARDRRAQEAAVRPALAASLGGSRPATAAALPAAVQKPVKPRKKSALPENQPDFVAAVPKPKKPGG